MLNHPPKKSKLKQLEITMILQYSPKKNKAKIIEGPILHFFKN